jgi:hypothetical protein
MRGQEHGGNNEGGKAGDEVGQVDSFDSFFLLMELGFEFGACKTGTLSLEPHFQYSNWIF